MIPDYPFPQLLIVLKKQAVKHSHHHQLSLQVPIIQKSELIMIPMAIIQFAVFLFKVNYVQSCESMQPSFPIFPLHSHTSPVSAFFFFLNTLLFQTLLLIFSDKVRLKSSKPSSKSCKILLVCNYLSCYNDKKHILQNLYGAFAIYILETADYL